MSKFPEHPDLETLRGLRNDRRYAERLAGSYWELLGSVSGDRLPGYCAEVADIFRMATAGSPAGDALGTFCNAGLSVTAIGMESLRGSDDPEMLGRLLEARAEFLEGLDRRIGALDCLRRAECAYDARRRMLEESGVTDMSSEEVRRCRHGYEFCRARTVQVMASVADGVPPDVRQRFDDGMVSSLSQSILFFRSYSFDRDLDAFSGLLAGIAGRASGDGYTADVREPDGYTAWCRDNNLFLDPFSGLPGFDSRSDRAYGLGPLWDDITDSFDHCRRLAFLNAYDQALRDCFVRLYSTMDKLAVLVSRTLGLDRRGLVRFPDIGEKLRMDRDGGLRAMDGICGGMYGCWSRPPGRCPEGYPVSDLADRRVAFREGLVFGEPVPCTGSELESEAVEMLRDVREAILTFVTSVR